MDALVERAKRCICFECTSATPAQRERRMLSCGHSMCRPCLDELLEKANQYEMQPGDVGTNPFLKCPLFM